MSARTPTVPPSAVRRSSIRIQRSPGKALDERLARLPVVAQALGQPLLFASGGRRRLAALDVRAKQGFELDAGRQQIANGAVHAAKLLVAQDQPILAVEDDDALRKGLDGIDEPPALRGRPLLGCGKLARALFDPALEFLAGAREPI